MDNASILTDLFDKKVLSIITVLFENPEKQFYTREIAKQSKVPVASTFRLLRRLVDLEIIDLTVIKHIKLYKASTNQKAKKIGELIVGRKTPLDYFVTEMQKTETVYSIIQHGKANREGVNILLIGRDIDANIVKNVSAAVKEKYNFVVSSLTVTEEQFKQMDKMGLYPRQKTVLFQRQ